MSFEKLYDAVQTQKGVFISTKWLKEQAIALSEIKALKEQWSGLLDPTALRGFYIEGPMGSPIPLSDNESLIVLSRPMCAGALGDHWRRFVYSKELMHVFDTPEEKAGSVETFSIQIDKFGAPDKPLSPQFRAEQKAYWRALMVLCPEARRLDYKKKIGVETSITVVASALRIPAVAVGDLMRDDFEEKIVNYK